MLADLARSDIATIHTNDGDRVTLTSPGTTPTVYADVPCDFVQCGVTRDADGFPVVGETAQVVISLSVLADRGITDPETFRDDWRITHDSTTYKRNAAPIDYTNGVVTMTLKKVAL